MKIQSSKMLLDFYQAWLDWAENCVYQGGLHALDDTFSQSVGLCGNLEYWLFDLDLPEEDWELIEDTMQEMSNQFEEAGLCEIYPFGRKAYLLDSENSSQHTDPDRLRWVKNRLKDGGILL